MKSLTNISLITILAFSSLLADNQNIKVNGNNNLVTQIVNKGLSQKTVKKFIQPYKDRIHTLELKLERTASMEEKYKLVEQLKSAREESKKKHQQIESLNKFIKNSNVKVVEEASKILEEKGIEATLKYFKSNKFTKFEKDTKQHMKEVVAGYRYQAIVLQLKGQGKEAQKLYKKSLEYDRTVESVMEYVSFIHDAFESIHTYEPLVIELKNLADNNPEKYKPYLAKVLYELSKFYDSVSILYEGIPNKEINNVPLYNKKALPTLLESFDLYKSLYKSEPTVYTGEMARIYRRLEGKKFLNKALKLYIEASQIEPDIYMTELADFYKDDIVRMYKNENNEDGVLDTYKKVWDIYNTLIAMHSNNQEFVFLRIMIYKDLAKIYKERGEINHAEKFYLKVLEYYNNQLRRKTSMRLIHDKVIILEDLLNLYASSNFLNKAKKTANKIFLICQKNWGGEEELINELKTIRKEDLYFFTPTNPEPLIKSLYLTRLIKFYTKIKKWKKVKELHKQLLFLARQDRDNFSPSFIKGYIFAEHLNNIALINEILGDNKKAEKKFLEALSSVKITQKSQPYYPESIMIMSSIYTNIRLFYLKTHQKQKMSNIYFEELKYKKLLNTSPMKKEYSYYLDYKMVNIGYANLLVFGTEFLNQSLENLDEAESILVNYRGNPKAEVVLQKIEKFRKR